MAEPIRAECGFCGKGFKLRPDQVGREVRCPHCKTKVKITPPTEAALEAAAVLGPALASQPKRPPTAAARASTHIPQPGLRNKNVAIVWVVLLAVGLVGVLSYAIYKMQTGGPGASGAQPPTRAAGTGAYNPAPYTPPGGVPAAQGGAGDSEAEVGHSGEAELVDVNVMQVFSGLKGDTLTYAVGQVRNKTHAAVQNVEVVVDLWADEDTKLGEAVCLVRRIEPGENVYYVAEWKHDPGQRPRIWAADYRINPVGNLIPTKLEVSGPPWRRSDSGGFNMTGEVTMEVTNAGGSIVDRIEAWAVFLDADGGPIGAARDEVIKSLNSGDKAEIAFRYEKVPNSRIVSVEGYAQGVAR